jgi:acyl-CoA thioester hydrolase
MRMTTRPERWPDVAGRIEGDAHILPVRVYYEDTDFSGAVYHANYLKFCERARSDALRLCGVWHREIMDRSGFVVRRLACDFLKPARIDDLLEVETRFNAVVGARLELAQRIKRGDEAVFTAEVTVALVNGQGRPLRVPASMIRALARLRADQS